MTIQLPEDPTIDELRGFLSQVSTLLEQKIREEAQQQQNLRGDIGSYISELESLLGPEEAAPGIESIRAVMAYDDETIVQNSGLAFRLILSGMQIIVTQVLGVSRIVGEDVSE